MRLTFRLANPEDFVKAENYALTPKEHGRGWLPRPPIRANIRGGGSGGNSAAPAAPAAEPQPEAFRAAATRGLGTADDFALSELCEPVDDDT